MLKPCPPTQFTGKKECIVCQSKKSTGMYTYTYHEQESHILSCDQCGHLFIDPVPLIDLKSRNMDTIEDAELFGSHVLKTLHEKLIINREIKTIKKILPLDQRLGLDIGCGTGWTTELWQKAGFHMVGLEPSKSRAEYCRKHHQFEVFEDYIEHFEYKEKFDFVVMRHLFEHIEHPQSVLDRARSFLKPNGVLLIVIPNINSIGRYLFKEDFDWVLPWHLHFYTPKSLSQLLINHKFSKIKVYQTPSPLWYPNCLNKKLGENHWLNKMINQLPRSIRIFLFSPIILLGMLLNLNDNMTLMFRKESDA